MGTLSYILFTYIHYIETLSKLNMPKGSGLTKPLPLHRARHSPRREEGRPAVQAGGRQEAVGLHQGEEAPGRRQQAVLHPRQDHGAHLWEGEGESFRYGEAPQGPPHRLVLEIRTFGHHRLKILQLSMDFCGDSVIQGFWRAFEPLRCRSTRCWRDRHYRRCTPVYLLVSNTSWRIHHQINHVINHIIIYVINNLPNYHLNYCILVVIMKCWLVPFMISVRVVPEKQYHLFSIKLNK